MNINDFPKAKEILINALIKDIKERNKNAEFKMFKDEDEETLSFLSEHFLTASLNDNPRSLFDIFDESNIFIGIAPYFTFANDLKNIGFIYNINSIESSKFFNNRKEAEEDAIWEAVKLLEEQKK